MKYLKFKSFYAILPRARQQAGMEQTTSPSCVNDPQPHDFKNHFWRTPGARCVKRLAPRRLLALSLLLPVAAWAESPWDCSRQAEDGQWICNSKIPLPQPARPAAAGSLATSPENGLPPATDSTPAAPAEIETSAADRNSTLPGTGAAGAVMQAPEPDAAEGQAAEPREAGSITGSAPAAEAAAGDGTEILLPPAAAEQPAAVVDEPAAPAIIPATGEQADIDRWALCPPVIRPAALQEGIDADTINLQADKAQASEGGVYTLNGNAVMRYGRQRLEAENIIYRKDSGEIEAQQGIRYTGPGLYVRGDSAALYPELRQGELHNVNYTLYEQHGRGEAKLLHLEGLAEQRLDKAYYTTCPPGHENWILSAREVSLDQSEGTGTARNAKLSFKGIPILYTPYATFPIDDRRKSGLLIPKFGQTEETGLDVSVPYYWNIAPNRDMTIVPRYMSDRGTMLGTEFRYLNARNQGIFSAEYLPSDKQRDNEDRSLVALEHYGNPWPRLKTSIKASNVSDNNYFEDLGTNLVQTSQTNLERTAAVDYYGTWWQLGMTVQDFQTIDATVTSSERPYKQLPQIVFSANPDSRLLGMKFETSAELNHFRHSDNSVVEGSRLDVQPRLSLPVYRAAWYIDPAVGVRHTVYDLNHTAADADNSPSRTNPIASLDTGSFFERNGHWGNNTYVQTLEPRLYYLYVPYRNQENLPVFDTGDYDFNYWTLFRDNRFTGPDRMGDANQLAVALTSRILDPASGVQLVSASLGSLLYFSDRKVTLPGDPVETDDSSDLIGEIQVALAHHWNAEATLHWNPHNSRTSRNDYRLQYRRGPRKLVNLSYRQQRDYLEQTDLSFLWPLSQNWHMVGRWYYSLQSSETIETLAGIGYESCCWGMQLLGRSYINNTEDSRNTAVFMQLELKGLGKLGTKVDEALERGILGYQADY
jgi:LPS-assembly protein